MRLIIKDIEIVNEGTRQKASVLVDGDIIAEISADCAGWQADRTIDGTGKILLPGAIDDQVHFREPGLTQKADIASESAAAVAGGVTSFMDMPNTKPQTTTIEALNDKYAIAAQKSVANYSFYIGATNDNIDVIKSVDYKHVCGIKLFMGSSTGNMLVDNEEALEKLFAAAPAIITAHCEDEATIRANIEAFKQKYGNNVPWNCHGLIRSAEACYKSSAKAAALARRHGTRLHILHLSTAAELDLLDRGAERLVTGEACVHHLWFTDADYETKKQYIKWNPAIKTQADRDALRRAVADGTIPVVATDHAPHTIEEKQGSYFGVPSGAPMVQHSLIAMLEMADQGLWSYETVAERMCHAPARLFDIKSRGFIRKGYKADIVIVEKRKWTVEKSNILYKCGWSPLEGCTFGNAVYMTLVNGQIAYENGNVNHSVRGERLEFER
ncbi:MAG: dihydroorotase [Bacteroidales bacterium]|nr:dihydroorotase [Bacteroidales bacterium]